jgi:inner membrane protein
VDSITQAVLGAAVGEWLLGKKLGNRALAWGAAFGTLPDLDVVLSPFLDTAAKLWWHRGPSHSLLLMIAAAWFLSPWLAKLWRKEKVSRAHAGWFVFAAWSTHVLIDCFTVYGTLVLWPFSNVRVGFNHLFIVDPLFTLPMLIALVRLAFLRAKKQIPQRRRINAWGLGIASAYALLSIAMKFVASVGFDADLDRRDAKVIRRMEAPTPFNILLWRSVADCGDSLWIGYRTVFESKNTPVRWTVYPKDAHVVENFGASREVKALRWFSNDWWIARDHVKGAWIADMRFGEIRNWGARKGMVDICPLFAWDYRPDETHDKLRQAGQATINPDETFKRLGLRIIGQRDAWDANPRLIGATGQLPENLAVEE